jgi:hypothetical protein
MQDEQRLPEFDVKAMARSLFLSAQKAGEGEETRVLVTADQVRWLARKRVSLALGTFPLFLLLGCSALLVSLNLALVAVLSGFFAYGCISIARWQHAVARDAVDFEVTVRGKELHLPGQAPRPIFKAIDRPDYLRLVSVDAWVIGVRLDNRSDPSASFDLPASRQSRRALCESLRAAGVDVSTEGAARRIVVLAVGLAVLLFGFTAARALLGLTAVAMVTWPMSWLFLVAVVVLAGLWWRRRE